MRKLDKVLSVLMIVVMLACVSTTVFAKLDVSNISDDANIGNAETTMASLGSQILTIVTNVGIILAVVLIAILGIKYMMGSTEEKAEYKKSMIPYIVGAILVFGASTVAKVVVNFADSI